MTAPFSLPGSLRAVQAVVTKPTLVAVGVFPLPVRGSGRVTVWALSAGKRQARINACIIMINRCRPEQKGQLLPTCHQTPRAAAVQCIMALQCNLSGTLCALQASVQGDEGLYEGAGRSVCINRTNDGYRDRTVPA